MKFRFELCSPEGAVTFLEVDGSDPSTINVYAEDVDGNVQDYEIEGEAARAMADWIQTSLDLAERYRQDELDD